MRFAFIILLFLFSSVLAAQGKQGKIGHIGVFEIGKTDISVIEQVKKELKTPVGKIVTMDDYIAFCGRQVVNFMAEVIRDTTTTQNRCFYSSYPANCKIYLLSAYKTDGLRYNHVVLIFLNGILVEFTSDGSSKIERSLNINYEMPEVITNEHEITYKKPGDVTFSQCPAKSTISTWVNGEIKAKLVVEESCTLPYPTYIYFQISNEQVAKELAEAQKNISLRIGKR